MARNMQERPLAGKVALVTGGSRAASTAQSPGALAVDLAPSVAVTYSKGADAATSIVKGDWACGGGKAIASQADAGDAEGGQERRRQDGPRRWAGSTCW